MLRRMKPEMKSEMKNESRRPVQAIRNGHVEAAIWESETKYGLRYRVSLKRSYKAGDQWKTSDSFWRDDLPNIVSVLDDAYGWISDHEKEIPKEGKNLEKRERDEEERAEEIPDKNEVRRLMRIVGL